PQVLIALPAGEVLAVEELNRLGFALARRHFRGLVGRRRLAAEQGDRGHDGRAGDRQQPTLHGSPPSLPIRIGSRARRLSRRKRGSNELKRSIPGKAASLPPDAGQFSRCPACPLAGNLAGGTQRKRTINPSKA